MVSLLRNPIVSTSIHDEDDVIEYTIDPELIFEKWQNLVDMIMLQDGNFPIQVLGFPLKTDVCKPKIERID